MVHLMSGFLVGFLGSAHCAGMCGPIALLLPGGGDRGFLLFAGRVLYNGGRVATYAILGLLVGALGRHLALSGFQQYLSIGIGIVILLVLLLPSNVRLHVLRFSILRGLHRMLKSGLASLLRRTSLLAMVMIGMVNGLLPCGFVYVALAGTATVGTELGGMTFMTGFGLGTLPVMLGISLVGPSLTSRVRERIAGVVPVMMFVIGVLFVLRGLDLGVPYVSPHLPSVEVGADATPCH